MDSWCCYYVITVSSKDDSNLDCCKHCKYLLISAVPSCPVGGDGGEADPGSSSQQVHCLFGLRLPDKNRVVSGHDHHERRRPEVRSHSLSLTDMLTTTSLPFILNPPRLYQRDRM